LPDLLLEVGCEELPSSACRDVLAQAPGLIGEALAAAGLEAGDPVVWVAPRRIAVLVPGLPEERPGRVSSFRGPPESAAFGEDGVPTKAGEGFARRHGLAPADLVVREHEGRRMVFADVSEPSVPTAELVPPVAERLVTGLRFGKSMRWGDGSGLRFSRPVRWLVAMLGDRAVGFDLAGLRAGDESRGHRFLGGPVRIPAAEAYRDALRGVGAVADHDERRAAIVAGLDREAAAAGCAWRDPTGKMGEVVFLVEMPSVVRGRFAEEHLRLPPEVLVAAMQGHQRYFPLERPDGSLEAGFLAVSNGDPAHAELIGRGYEDVLEARLQDAAFSFDRDREAGLDALGARLERIVFSAKLGSMADRRARLVESVAEIANAVGLDATDADAAVDAARLAKADQGAVLVAEFSDLQGLVGAEYARLEGHPEPVWRAVAEQYLPSGPSSPAPSTAPGAALALADKLDALTGFFLAGEAPTGSRDPHGLRRAAAGVVRIALERGWDLRTRPVCESIAAAYAAQGADVATGAGALDQLEDFIAERLVNRLAEEGVGAESARAALGPGSGGLAAAAAWARAIEGARDSEAFGACWTAATRTAKLAARGPEEEGGAPGEPAERALADAIDAARPAIAAARADGSLDRALAAGLPLAGAVDVFLTDVLVNAEEPEVRARRFRLVREAAQALAGIADFPQVTEGTAER
jgi:glycyl-tRNA synthetase beta chain